MNKITQIIGLILYLVGAFLALALLALSVWGEAETITFDAAVRSDERLRSLNCPVFITKDETGIISATIKNNTDRDANPNVRSRISQGFVTLVEEEWKPVSIPAHSARQVEWEVTSENAAYNRLILARIYQFRNYDLPSRQEACGIVVLPFSGPTGQQVFFGGLILSVVIMAGGLSLYRDRNLDPFRRNSPENIRHSKIMRAFIYLGTYLVAAALLTLMGDWLVSILLMVFAVASVIGVFSFTALSR